MAGMQSVPKTLAYLLCCAHCDALRLAALACNGYSVTLNAFLKLHPDCGGMCMLLISPDCIEPGIICDQVTRLCSCKVP